MVRAGSYRDRVRIEEFIATKDNVGAAARTWESRGEVQAQIMEMAPGSELFNLGTEVAEGTTRVRIREVPGLAIDPAWRLVDVDKGTILEIVQILPTRLREELTLLCKHGGSTR